MEITAAGAGLTKISVRTQKGSMPASEDIFPAISRCKIRDDYSIYFSYDIGETIGAIIAHIDTHKDTLIDLRVERPSLEDRFLEITQTNGKYTGAVP